MYRRILGFAFRVFISIGLLIFLFSRINMRNLSNHIQSMDHGFFALGILFFIFYLCTWALRWQLFISDTGIQVKYLHTLRTLLVGLAVSLFLPSAVGADVGRAYDMARTQVQKVAILSTVLMDRLIGLIAVVGMAVIAIIIAGYQYLTLEILLTIIGLALMMLASWIIFFNILFMRRFRHIFENIPIINQFSGKIRDIYLALYYLQRKRSLFITAITISIITVMLEILSVIMLSYAIGDRVDPVFFFLFLPIIWVILIIPIAIGGLGLRETVFVFFFSQVGMDTSHAVTISLLYYSLYAVTGIISGTIPITHNLYIRLKQILNHNNPPISEKL